MTPQIAQDGTRYEWVGPEDGPPLVLIHGLGMNRAMWQWTVPALGEKYRVLTYDNLGHGETPPATGAPDLAMLAEQLRGVLDASGVDSAAVVGFSLGGMIARRFAMDHPARVRALAILHSAHERTPEAQAAVEARVELVRRKGPQATVDDALDRWFTERFRAANPRMIDLVRGWILANDRDTYAPVYRILADGVAELVAPSPPIAVPALVLTGDEDFGNGPEMSHAIAAEIPGARTVILKGLRHMALAEDPALVNAALVEFLDEALGG